MKSLDDYLKTAPKNSKGQENFSKVDKDQIVTFACGDSSLVSVSVFKPSETEIANNLNFSSTNSTLDTEGVMDCFSVGFLQFYMEETKPARDSLKRRIQQIVNFIKSKDADTLSKPSVKKAMRKYIYQFILQKIQDYVSMIAKSGSSEDKSGNANLILALGIGPYLTDRKHVGHLQMTLKMIAPQLKKDGTMQKNLQVKVKESFDHVFADIMKTIENKFLPEEKRGYLTGKTVAAGKAEKTKA